jgi:hypothetical protein
MAAAKGLRVDIPGVLPGPMDPFAAGEFLEKKDPYEVTEADEQMMATGHGQLVGQFLLDRQGIVRWSFTEVPEGGRYMFGAPNPRELMSAVSQVAQ